jgi:hypothetical protein
VSVIRDDYVRQLRESAERSGRKLTLTTEEIAAIVTVIELAEEHPPHDEHWDTAERHGPHLHKRLANWLKEQL